MEILLDLQGWQKEISLYSEDAILAVESGRISICIQKPLDSLVKNIDIIIDPITSAMSLEFKHLGFYLNDLPIYKYID